MIHGLPIFKMAPSCIALSQTDVCQQEKACQHAYHAGILFLYFGEYAEGHRTLKAGHCKHAIISLADLNHRDKHAGQHCHQRRRMAGTVFLGRFRGPKQGPQIWTAGWVTPWSTPPRASWALLPRLMQKVFACFLPL